MGDGTFASKAPLKLSGQVSYETFLFMVAQFKLTMNKPNSLRGALPREIAISQWLKSSQKNNSLESAERAARKQGTSKEWEGKNTIWGS